MGRLAHEKFTDPAIGRLLDDLRPYEESLPYDSDEAGLLRVTRRDYERAVKVPPSFTAEFYSHSAASYEAWTKARPANDFAAVRPLLEKTLDLSRQYADFFPGYAHIADPLIDASDYGMKAASVRALFAALREQLVPIVQAITAQPPADDTLPEAALPRGAAAGVRRGGDQALRLRFRARPAGQDPPPVHDQVLAWRCADHHPRQRERPERGAVQHAARGRPRAVRAGHPHASYEGTPLASGTSAGVHESQSRLWENIVGRSRGFWQFFYPRLQAVFPEQLGQVPLDTFYRAINKVERSLIRTDADEVTYNLHVMMRFDFELELLEGKLEVRDLPEAWWERMKSDLGITPPDDRDGVLQDVHWYAGTIGGAFQGYTLGNILSAQFFEGATRAHPQIAGRDRGGRVWDAARLAEAEHLPARPQVHRRRAGRARHRRPAQLRAVHPLSAREVWRAV